MALQAQKSQDDYFQEAGPMRLTPLTVKWCLRPNLAVTDNLFQPDLRSGKPDIRPQGHVDISAGYQGQNIQNPTLPESARKTGGLDFNEDANLNVVGAVGSKLKPLSAIIPRQF